MLWRRSNLAAVQVGLSSLYPDTEQAKVSIVALEEVNRLSGQVRSEAD
jgi:hypothetical protein